MATQPCHSNKCNGRESEREHTGTLESNPLDPAAVGPVDVHRCVRCGMRYFSPAARQERANDAKPPSRNRPNRRNRRR